jgi:hypothetical protein
MAAFNFLTCNGYVTIERSGDYDCDAPKRCAELEAERNDGFAVVASSSGELVADAEGWWTPPTLSAYERAVANVLEGGV